MATINLGRIKPIWQGAWDSGTSYVADDIVYYNNSAWIAQTSNTNSAPSGVNANWELMALGTDIPTQTGNDGKVLKTDGSSLSWGAAGLIQQVSTTKTDTWSVSTNSVWTDITGLSIAITPSYSNSKIKIEASIMFGCTGADILGGIRIIRTIDGGSEVIPTGSVNDEGGGATGSQRFNQAAFRSNYDTNGAISVPVLFVDSPNTTGVCVYKIQLLKTQNGTYYVNRTALDSASYPCRGTSTLTLTEIAG